MDKNIDKSFLILSFCIVVLVFGSIYFLKPEIAGDSPSYLESINFLETGMAAENFVPNRLMTTLAPLYIIIWVSKISGSVLGTWLALNAICYTLTAFIFYKLLKLIFEDNRVSMLGTLFLIGNYAALNFGLRFLMDMGGWMFYIATLYFMLRYAKFANRRDIITASILVGVGGLFKEYALLGVIPIAFFLLYENKQSIRTLLSKSILPALISVGPIALVYTWIYLKFGYTYLDWTKNSYQYFYSSSLTLRIIEYIKSLGSLYNLLTFFVIGGTWSLWKVRKQLDKKFVLFIFSMVASFTPVFFWGGVTQRLLFITVPAFVLIASFFFQEYKRYFYWFLPVFIIYLLMNFFMDSFILQYINLPF